MYSIFNGWLYLTNMNYSNQSSLYVKMNNIYDIPDMYITFRFNIWHEINVDAVPSRINSHFWFIRWLYISIPAFGVCLYFIFAQNITPWSLFSSFSAPRISHHSECKYCQHVLMTFMLYVDNATTQEGECGQKDRYNCLSFP